MNKIQEEIEKMNYLFSQKTKTDNSCFVFKEVSKNFEDINLFFEKNNFLYANWHVLTNNVAQDFEKIQKKLDCLCREVSIDGLTGLFNRKYLDTTISIEMEKAFRGNTSLCFAIFDIDDFKKVNDVYGHQCGDHVLQLFSKLINNSIRKIDIPARYGGEEFCVVFPQTSLYHAKKVLNRFLEQLRQMTIVCPDSKKEFSITCSIGVSCYKGISEETPEKLLSVADKSLYEAKNTGKDRVVDGGIIDVLKTKKKVSRMDIMDDYFESLIEKEVNDPENESLSIDEILKTEV
jgi:diguanylate cyclase (GGDEF)-like protein